jgi:PII interaction protein X
MALENYLNHPNFGLLSRLCLLEGQRELFTTLYAQRLFFLVDHTPGGLQCESISRNDARMLLENRMRILRRNGQLQEYGQLQKIYQQTF